MFLAGPGGGGGRAPFRPILFIGGFPPGGAGGVFTDGLGCDVVTGGAFF